MKRILLLLLTAVMILSVVSCDDDKKKPSTTPSKTDPKEPEHTHVWGDWETVTEATCTKKGSEKRVCECGEEETKEIDVKEHTYKETVTAPTCSSEGYTTYTCECGDVYTGDKIAKVAHSYHDWYDVKPATCTEKGSRCRVCSVCNAFETEETSIKDHVYKPVVTDPTCSSQGYTTYTCECGDKYVGDETGKAEHSYGDWYDVQEATCTEKGSRCRVCSVCNAFETEDVPAKHDYEAVVTAPDCTGKGYTTHTCKTCGDSYVDSEVNALGHSYGSWYVSKQPTCGEVGEERRDCGYSNCKHYQTRTYGTALKHNYDMTGAVESTLTTKGYAIYTCEHCGDSYNDDYLPVYDATVAFDLIKHGKEAAYIVVPSTVSTNTQFAVNKLVSSVKSITGVSLASGTKTGSEYEILIGDTGRTESTALKATLSGNKYAIKLADKKLVIVATNDAFLYEAVKYFIDTYLVEDRMIINETNVIITKASVNVKKAGDTSTLRYKLSAGSTTYSATVEEFTTATNIHYDSSYGKSTTIPYRRQGGCFNGEKYYQSLITWPENDGEEAKYGRIMMKNVVTGETVFSEPMEGLGHMNDMEYNPDLNEVMVANGSKIIIFDGDTLEYKRTETSNVSASASLAYDPIGHRYIVGYYQFKNSLSGSTVKKFSHSSEVTLANYNANQGSGSDGCYVVSLLAHSKGGRDGGYNCHVVVYDMDGNYLGLIDVYIEGDLEPENVSVVDGVLYIGTCTSQPVATLYKVVIS